MEDLKFKEKWMKPTKFRFTNLVQYYTFVKMKNILDVVHIGLMF